MFRDRSENRDNSRLRHNQNPFPISARGLISFTDSESLDHSVRVPHRASTKLRSKHGRLQARCSSEMQLDHDAAEPFRVEVPEEEYTVIVCQVLSRLEGGGTSPREQVKNN